MGGGGCQVRLLGLLPPTPRILIRVRPSMYIRIRFPVPTPTPNEYDPSVLCVYMCVCGANGTVTAGSGLFGPLMSSKINK